MFCPSDILHSKDWASALCNAASPIIDQVPHILICHKDQTSFYKSTRKACRTAGRILWPAATGDRNAVSPMFDGFFVGKEEHSPVSGGGEKANAAIHKRLSSEFGNIQGEPIIIDMSNVSVRKYSPDDRDGSGPIDSGEGLHSERANVIFFDLDSIYSTANMHDASDQQAHHSLMLEVLSLLTKEVPLSKNSVIHVKSETMYHIVTSIGPSTPTNGSGKMPCGVSGEELEKHLLSRQNENEAGGSISSGNDVIRRLRNKKGAANCPLSVYPARFVELPPFCSSPNTSDKAVRTVEICRFHNYDAERGCLRSKKAQQNSEVKGCDMDHDHCHRCGGGHRAFECPNSASLDDAHLSSLLFRKTENGSVTSTPYHDRNMNIGASRGTSLPALLVLGGRLRGRTLATCEMLPLSPSTTKNNEQQWIALPNLHEHRGSHAACSPVGSGLVFVLGGGTADGNSDAVEMLDFGCADNHQEDGEKAVNGECQWHIMAGKLSCPRHAFGAVSFVSSKQTSQHRATTSGSLYAVGGWKYGSVSCESVERLDLEYPISDGPPEHGLLSQRLREHARWELCAPLLLPRRLHSVAASNDGSSIFVFGGYIDERMTTTSIERYDVVGDKWSATDNLPFAGSNCPLVQAVADRNGFLIFPFSTEQTMGGNAPSVLRYTPGSRSPFSPVLAPKSDHGRDQLHLPLANWHSFSATSSPSLNKAFLVGGTLNGKWTDRSYELDLQSYEWKELPPMPFARRRLATLVLE